MEVESINMVNYLPVSSERLQSLQRATELDTDLQKLQNVIQQGWPAVKEEVPLAVTMYFHYRDELSVQNGVIFRGERVVVPAALRQEIMQRIHSSHIGVEGCLRRARECVHWPGMNAQLKTYMEQCSTCSAWGVKQQKETLRSHEVPKRPWEKVGTDLFSFDDRDYLVTVDYLSNFWEVDQLEKNTQSKTVIRKLKSHFARYGIRDIVYSDNGPQYSSDEFKRFSWTGILLTKRALQAIHKVTVKWSQQ